MYYSLFGSKGLVAGSKARLLKRTPEVAVKVPALARPLHLRLRTTDVELCGQVFLQRHYDCELLRSPKIIVDAGANIGLVSVFYASKYPGARVIAVEPEGSNYEMLTKNAAPYPNITTV